MAPDVVLLHGFTHTGASWGPVVAALGKSYRALAPDIRGHGSASDRRPVTVEAVLDDLAALAPARFTLAGYSMGGRLALHAALALPDRVERLVLIGASHALADQAERSTIEEFAGRWARTPVLAGQPPDVAAAVDADRRRNQPAGLAGALRGLGTGALPSLWDRLPEIARPVALVVGERDQKFRAIASEMAAGLRRADVVVVPGAGHAVHLEAPDAVARTISGD